MKRLSLAFAVAIVASPTIILAADNQNTATMEFNLHPIGQVKKHDDRTLIVLDENPYYGKSHSSGQSDNSTSTPLTVTCFAEMSKMMRLAVI